MMPTQGASARFQQDDPIKRYLEQYNKASPNERIGMLKILRLTLEQNQIKKEFQEAIQEASTSGAVSNKTLKQLKR